MLKAIDKIYFRFANAWMVFRNPDALHEEYGSGLELGKQIATAEMRRTLRMYSPDSFSNNHFKLGYYYAAEQLKKELIDDENRSLD